MNNVEKISWKDSGILHNVDWDKYDLISLDIFDTILHRTVPKPEDLFLIIARKAKKANLLCEDISEQEFKDLRIGMESKARLESQNKTGSREVILKDIWDYAPYYINKEKMYNLEIETETQHTYLNIILLSLIKNLTRKKKRIILTSDTYFTKNQLRRILCKKDIIFKELGIYASCEYRKSKYNGTLFDTILIKEAIEAKKIIHIGDNYTADYIYPKKKGIKTIHLACLQQSTEYIKSSALLGHYGEIDPFNSYRRIYGLVDTSNNYFCKFGFEILAPILFSWSLQIVTNCKKRNITKLLPLMREAILLKQPLEIAAKILNYKIDIEELFVSRHSTLVPSFNGLEQEAITKLLSIRNYTTNDFINHWGLEAFSDEILSEKKESFVELYSTDKFKKLLSDNNFRSQALTKSITERKKINLYFKKRFGNHKKVAFVDLGPAGNTSCYINKICTNCSIDINLTTFFLYSTEAMGRIRQQSHEYITFLPNSPFTSRKIKTIVRTPEIIETILTGLGETTIGYRENTNTIIPVTKKIINCTEQTNKLESVKTGLNHGLHTLLKLYNDIDLSCLFNIDARESLLNSLWRIIELPTFEEAKELGSLIYDDNGGASSYQGICEDAVIQKTQEHGLNCIIAHARKAWSYRASMIRWPQGVATLLDPTYLCSQYLNVYNDIDSLLVSEMLISQVKDDVHDSGLVLFGGGEIGKNVLNTAKLWNVNIDYIVDSDQGLHGNYIDNVKIISLSDSIEKGYTRFIISSVAFSREIESILVNKFERIGKSNLRIYSINTRF